MELVPLTVGTRELTLYRADNPRAWRQGLVGCDLAGVDGMLFTVAGDVQYPFHMNGMTQPVLASFFTAAGDYVDLAYLEVDSSPFQPVRPYRYALELVGAYATTGAAVLLLPALLEGIAPP
jgi:uncharacterized membrane protein (UPF0127 family)